MNVSKYKLLTPHALRANLAADDFLFLGGDQRFMILAIECTRRGKYAKKEA